MPLGLWPSGFGHTYQANHSYLCYNYYMYLISDVICIILKLKYLITDAQPSLMMWNLDLDNNTIFLQFNSPSLNPANNGMPIDCTAMLIGPVTGDINMAVQLPSSAEGLQIDESTVVCDLGMEFRSILNANSGLGTDPTNTFLYYDSSRANGGPGRILLLDSSNMEYSDTTGTVATQVMPDSNSPAIAGFELLDLDEGLIVFSFTQPINVTTFDFADLSLQNSPVNETASRNLPLTNGSCEGGCATGRYITFHMAQADLEQIKLTEGICASISTCYPHHTYLLAQDFGENYIYSYTFSLNYLLQSLILDTTHPALVFCNINLSMDNLVLIFDEPIDAVTFNPLGITLQDNAGETESTLTSKSSTRSPSASIIIINLGIDVDKLKTSTLVTSGNDIYISLLPSAFEDIAGNTMQSALMVCNVTSDSHSPSVDFFNLDLNSNLLHVTFSEPILLDSLNISGFKVANSVNVDVHNTVNLNDSCLFDCNDSPADDAVRMISIAFGSQSLTQIKTDNNIGTTVDNIYLFIDNDSFTDTNGNGYVSLGPIAAATIEPDNSPATAIDFSLDMNIGQISLTFNDVVDVSTWHNQKTFIQYNSKQSLSGIIVTDNSNVIIVNISNLNSLKQQLNYGTATELDTTYLTIQAHAINDIRGVDITAVTNDNGIIANDYVRDSEPPQLMYFDLDMDNGIIWFYFDEPIAGNRFYPSLFTLQGDSMATTYSSSLNLSFSSGLRYCHNYNCNPIYSNCYYNLPYDVLYILRRNPNIARDANTSTLVIMQGGVDDTSGNPTDMTGPINVRYYRPGRSELYKTTSLLFC